MTEHESGTCRGKIRSMARPVWGNWALSGLSVGIDHVGKQERYSPTGRAGSGLLHRAVFPKTVSVRRMPDRAPLGERVSSRISANAVGRRGYFPQGAVFLRIRPCCPLREMRRAGGPRALPKAGDGIQIQNQRTASVSEAVCSGSKQRQMAATGAATAAATASGTARRLRGDLTKNNATPKGGVSH